MKRAGAGRPSVPDRELQKNRSFKASDAEYEEIKARAKQAGVTTSEYIRSCALSGPVYISIEQTKEVCRLLDELNNIFKAQD